VTRGTPTCPVCGFVAEEPFLIIGSVPVNPSALWPTARTARAAPSGDIALALCEDCGTIWNLRFDGTLLTYDERYESSLHFSDGFRQFSTSLADELAARHRLAGKRVVEIGCGKGEFLALLCERAGCSGIGFDPSYDGEADGRAGGRLEFIREPFANGNGVPDADLVICRHVIEHLAEPVTLLSNLRRSLNGRPVSLYVEVPAAEYLLREHTVWDLIYTHVTYFSAPALRRLLLCSGYEVLDSGFSFGGQYLWAEVTTAARTSHASQDGDGVPAVVHNFARHASSKCERWGRVLMGLLEKGPVALWGAGAKGVTFLNVVAGADAIRWVVDVNPRKHGSFVPGTGQQIIAPEELPHDGDGAVVVMNPLYRAEISSRLRSVGFGGQVILA
jgi:SAM-dependent methyltransferase